MDLDNLPHLLTAKQAAKILFDTDSASGRNRVYDWISNGDLRATKRTGKWWISKNEIERVID